MSALTLNKPISTSSGEIILLPDEIGQEPSDVTQGIDLGGIAGCTGFVRSFIQMSDLEKARENYPGVPVFGFWQLLFANSLVEAHADEPCVVYPLESGRGLYIVIEDGCPVSGGQYTGGMIPGFMGMRPDESEPLRISASDIGTLLPAAKLPAEVLAELDRARRASLVRLSIACMVIFAMAFTSDWMNRSAYEEANEFYLTQEAALKSLKRKAAKLGASKNQRKPDQIKAIRALNSVFAIYPKAKLLEQDSQSSIPASLDDKTFRVVLPPGAQLFPGFPSRRLQTGETELLIEVGK